MGQASTKQELQSHLNALSSGPIQPEDPKWEFWLKTDLPPKDSLNLIPLTELEKIRKDQPNNFVILVNKTVTRLYNASKTENLKPGELKEVTNGIRLLTRLLPVAFQDSNFTEKLFWTEDTKIVPITPAVEPEITYTSNINERTPMLNKAEIEHVSNAVPIKEAEKPITQVVNEPSKENEVKALPDREVKESAITEQNIQQPIGNIPERIPNDEVAEIVRETEEPIVPEDNESKTEKDTPLEFEISQEDHYDESGKEKLPTVELSAQQSSSLVLTSIKKPNELLGYMLLDSLVHFLFFPGYTLPPLPKNSSPSDVWTGIKIETKAASSKQQYDTNKIMILTALLVTFSQPIYQTPDEVLRTGLSNKFVDHIVCKECYYSQTLLSFLLNTVVQFDPVGWGLPYNYVIYSDIKEELLYKSLQSLSILLEYRKPSIIPVPLLSSSAPQYTTSHHILPNTFQPDDNIFIKFLNDLPDQALSSLFNSIISLLNDPIAASNTYLPSSKKTLLCHQELMIVFWHLLQGSQRFFKLIVQSDNIVDILYPLLHYAYEGRKDDAQIGIVQIVVFILMILSGEREFSVLLNKPLTLTVLIDIELFTGSYADLIVLVLIKLMVDGHKRLEALWECILTILSNLSPYIKSLSMVSSLKLLKLFDSLTRPQFLFFKERNHRYVFFLLEFFNNIIQYQYEGNTHLLYAIIRHRQSFSKLIRLRIGPQIDVTTEENVVNSEQASKSLSSSTESSNEKKESSPKQEQTSTHVVPKTTPHSNFVPTDEWLRSWQQRLPVPIILQFLASLAPKIEHLLTNGAVNESAITDYLKKTTLVGLLPVPHPILIRRYQSNPATRYWMFQYIWGIIYLRNMNFSIFNEKDIQLFIVHKTKQ
eukprot:TRINITY_DN3522_c0_g1_i1.p1 TRINITY_DN3522_c0_g1~~TRINITY_DN3522_c0_g1_i1.p1  ORF type:complete len:876 (-),score=148.76 TRINITY_DN3522_c0_g1_i1:16-2643(-)